MSPEYSDTELPCVNGSVEHFIAWENDRFFEVSKTFSLLSQAIYSEIKEIFPKVDQTLEYPDGDFAYFSRSSSTSLHPIYLRRLKNGSEQLILDPNQLLFSHEFVSIHPVLNSPDHRYLVFGLNKDGSERLKLFIKNLDDDHISDGLHDAAGDVAWLTDSRSFLYIRLDEFGRPSLLYRHTLGTSQADDLLLYEEKAAHIHLSLTTSESKCYIILGLGSHTGQDFIMIDAATGSMESVGPSIKEGKKLYVTDHHDEIICLVLGHSDQPVLKKASIEDPSGSFFDIYSFLEQDVVQDVKRFNHWLVFSVYRQARNKLLVLDLNTLQVEEILFKDEVFEADIIPVKDYHRSGFYFRYSSLTTPTSIFEYHFETKAMTKIKEPFRATLNWNENDFTTRRMNARGHDGVSIPITIAGSKEAFAAGDRPLVLYAYGAYGTLCSVAFNPYNLPYLKRGFLYAIAHVRGGGELGESWHHAGQGRGKLNSIQDYLSCISLLVDKRLTSPGNIIGIGESAGALVVANAVIGEPELFRSLILKSPFLDVVGSLLDQSQALTPSDILEFGDPSDSLDRAAIRKYSPYDSIVPANYPSIYIICGEADSRVPISESLRWLTKIRDYDSGGRCKVMQIKSISGHHLYNNEEEAALCIADEIGFVVSRFNEEVKYDEPHSG